MYYMTKHGYSKHLGHVGQRFCSRCYKALTDAASQEVGVGPICRNLDNALLAAKIPSDLPKALEAYKSVDVGTLPPETVATFIKLEADIIAPDAETRLDWRETVKRIEWMRSFGMPSHTYQHLLHIVEALGYIGVASMWKGEAASGEATCAFVEGRLMVQGPQNKSFRIAIKKLMGWKYHQVKPGEERPWWSLPASQSAAFQTLLMGHYPNHKGLGDALTAAQKFEEERKAAAEAAAKAAAEKMAQTLALDPVLPPWKAPPEAIAAAITAAVESAIDAPQPDAYVKVAANGALLLKTPYHKGFIADLKTTIPYGNRAWDGIDKVWKVSPQYKTQALAILTKFFPAADVSAVQ
jgi:hypothetical protein